MLSFAYRRLHGFQRQPTHPQCRACINSNSLGRGRPTALFCRGITQTHPVALRKTKEKPAQTSSKEKKKATPEATKTSTKKTSKATKPSTAKDSEKTSRSEKSRTPSSKSPSSHTPEEIKSLWAKSMLIVGDLNKIGPEKLTDSQATLMAGTLDVIKTVLSSKARKIAVAGAAGETKVSEGADTIDGKESDTSLIFTKVKGGARRLPPTLRAFERKDTQNEEVPLAQRPRPGDDTTIPDWHQKHKHSVEVLKPAGPLTPIDVPTPPVPLIQYGLDRVLFNEGVYVLQDPRTGVYNFDPYLGNIMPVTEFDYDALKEYITSSRDEILIGVTKAYKKKYTGSTSSMTGTLSHFHFLLSSWRKINNARLSRDYEPENNEFVGVLKAPAATFLNYNDGVYAIDADKEWDTDTVLSMLGKSMEMLLTAPREEYEKYRRDVSHKLTEEERDLPESYHYTEFGDFVMRSQLDAYDPRLPGTGIYDLKTRAVVSIRMDATNHHNGRDYEIRKRTGQWESFEREYHDMIRGAFLKYSLQVRMGRMDGIFVAYHNTQRIFGFQYIPLEEMDLSIHGTMDKTLGDKEFRTSLQLWNMMLNKATEKFPGQSLRCHVETRPSVKAPFMYFFAEPVTPEEVKQIQVKDEKQVEKFRQDVLGFSPPEPTVSGAGDATKTDDLEEGDILAEDLEYANHKNVSSSVTEKGDSIGGALLQRAPSEATAQALEAEDSEEVWENIMSVVEETMENDARGITAIREAIEEALQQSGLLEARSSEEAQHYIDSLLKAIVDVEAQKTEAGVAIGTESALTHEADAEKAAAHEVGNYELYGNQASTMTETSTTNGPSVGFFSRIMNSFRKKEDSEPETKTDEHPPQNSELVDLIIKMTSRANIPGKESKVVREVSDDQAKLQNFETLLSELTASESEEPESESGTASPKQRSKVKAKPLFGLILTSRNKVDNEYVARPENLDHEDQWQIEYRMEEIPPEKVRGLYEALKTRRKRAFGQGTKQPFHSIFNGELKAYSERGAKYRASMDRLDKAGRPMFAVNSPTPFYLKTLEESTSKVPLAEPIPPLTDSILSAKKTWEKYLAKQRRRQEAESSQGFGNDNKIETEPPIGEDVENGKKKARSTRRAKLTTPKSGTRKNRKK